MKMRKQMPVLESPLNADERLLYAIAVRLDRVIELLEDKVDVKEPEIIIASEIIEEAKEEVTSKKRTTKKK